MDYELEKSHGWKWFLWKISACGESFRSSSQKHLKTHLFVKYRCHSVRISHLKSWKWDAVAWIHISQAQEILTNILSEEDGRFWALSSVKTWPLKASQMHCSVPVSAIMLGRTVQSSELWVMCQWWGIFNHALPWSSSSWAQSLGICRCTRTPPDSSLSCCCSMNSTAQRKGSISSEKSLS